MGMSFVGYAGPPWLDKELFYFFAPPIFMREQGMTCLGDAKHDDRTCFICTVTWLPTSRLVCSGSSSTRSLLRRHGTAMIFKLSTLSNHSQDLLHCTSKSQYAFSRARALLLKSMCGCTLSEDPEEQREMCPCTGGLAYSAESSYGL